jgi:lipooligosaccharide transport system ATP-binding protein
MNAELVIETRGLRKRYGAIEVVSGVDLAIPRGGCFGLLGPNGAGKTTTLRMILGQSPPSAGSLHVLGLPMPGQARRVRARLGVVPQTDNLDPDFTVGENLIIYASYFGIGRAEAGHRMGPLLDLVELADRADVPIRQLSGGMKRRLSIARALINAPEVLILDEPTTGLDPQVRHLVWTRLRDLKRAGTTLLLTTHYMEEAERLCDTLVILDAGRVIAQGNPRALIREQVESDVIEIHGDGEPVRRALAALGDSRIEAVGTTHYCYTTTPASLVARLEAIPGVSYAHRGANLEDVFLRLTGRDLRE